MKTVMKNFFVGRPDPCERVVSALQFCAEFESSNSSDDIVKVPYLIFY